MQNSLNNSVQELNQQTCRHFFCRREGILKILKEWTLKTEKETESEKEKLRKMKKGKGKRESKRKRKENSCTATHQKLKAICGLFVNSQRASLPLSIPHLPCISSLVSPVTFASEFLHLLCLMTIFPNYALYQHLLIRLLKSVQKLAPTFTFVLLYPKRIFKPKIWFSI